MKIGLAGQIALTALLAASSVSARQDSPRRMAPVQAGRRLALLIGNQNYQRKPLRNPRADAESLSSLLRTDLGFTDVKLIEDVSLSEMQHGIREFIRQIRPGDLALFYYSGHGMQVAGVNWMIPVDFHADFEDEVSDQAYSAQRVLKDLEDAGATVRILILDACRDNPLPAAGRRSIKDGLAEMNGAEGTYLLFATAENQTASDNPRGRNGLFTSYLLESLRQPGITLDSAFKETRRGVSEASGGKQRPWMATDIDQDLILKPANRATVSSTTSSLTAPKTDVAAEAWEMVKDSINPEDLEDFAKTFPTSERVPVAKMRAAQLRRASSAVAASPKPSATSSMPRAATKALLPDRIVECESPNCIPGSDPSPQISPVWKFSGMTGDGYFGTGVQPLTIEHYDGTAIVIRRHDTSGPAMGMSARYMGVIEGNQITGSITYWPGQNTAPWTAKIDFSQQPAPGTTREDQSSAPAFPFRVVECEGNSCTNPAAAKPIWTFASTQGRGHFGTGDQPLTLVHLDGSLIVVRREDTTGPARGLIAVYIGTITGNRVDGSVTYWHGGGPRTGTWSGVLE